MGTGSYLGSALALASDDWIGVAITGSTAYLSGFRSRPPLAASGTGTVIKNYTAELGVETYENIDGCNCTFVAKTLRDYAVLLTIDWQWQSGNWGYEYIRITANASATGIFPTRWTKSINAGPDTTEYQPKTMMFILPNWKPGTYTIQAQHTPNNSGQDRYIRGGCVAVL